MRGPHLQWPKYGISCDSTQLHFPSFLVLALNSDLQREGCQTKVMITPQHCNAYPNL